MKNYIVQIEHATRAVVDLIAADHKALAEANDALRGATAHFEVQYQVFLPTSFIQPPIITMLRWREHIKPRREIFIGFNRREVRFYRSVIWCFASDCQAGVIYRLREASKCSQGGRYIGLASERYNLGREKSKYPLREPKGNFSCSCRVVWKNRWYSQRWRVLGSKKSVQLRVRYYQFSGLARLEAVQGSYAVDPAKVARWHHQFF